MRHFSTVYVGFSQEDNILFLDCRENPDLIDLNPKLFIFVESIRSNHVNLHMGMGNEPFNILDSTNHLLWEKS